MLNERDIYTHLANGGEIKDLHKALENEIKKAQDRLIKEKDAELKKQETERKAAEARARAFKALKDYVTLVNPTLSDAFLNAALDACGDFKVIISKDAQTPDWLLDLFRLI